MLRLSCIAAAALLASACTSTEVDPVQLDSILVQAKSAPGASMDGKTTYAWAGSIAGTPGADERWREPAPEITADIKRLANAEFADRGLTESNEAPSMIVRYGAGVDMTVMNLVDATDGGMTEIDPGVKVGVCLVVFDAATGAPMWVGAATDDIDWSPTEERTETRLSYAIERMFERFPE